MPQTLTNRIAATLSEESLVLFAYLYGSVAENGIGNDIDIAVFAAPGADEHHLSADLKISLHKKLGLSPDHFDIRMINGLLDKDDIFGLLFLKDLLSGGKLLVERDADSRSAFLERYGKKFRECEGLIRELLS